MKKKHGSKTSNRLIQSPEELDNYVRIAHPGYWVALGSIVMLLLGVLVWGFVGRLETKVKCAAYSAGLGGVANKGVVAYVPYKDASKIKGGQILRVDNKEFILSGEKTGPLEFKKIAVDELSRREIAYLFGWKDDDLLYEFYTEPSEIAIDPMVHDSVIVTGSVPPLYFAFN